MTHPEPRQHNTLAQATEGRFPSSLVLRGGGYMSTYEEFMIILTTGLLIIAILNFTHKK